MAAYYQSSNTRKKKRSQHEQWNMEPPGRVSLAYRGFKELPRSLVESRQKVFILDLGYNNLSDIRQLESLPNLHTLILDSNLLTSHTVFPPLPCLEILWVNDNKITNLALFIEGISSIYPNLKYLSMMKNDAAPSYFNGGTKTDYEEYRYYVISQLPKLIALDDTAVSHNERQKSSRFYGGQRRRRSSSLLEQRNGAKQAKKHRKPSERTHLLEETDV